MPTANRSLPVLFALALFLARPAFAQLGDAERAHLVERLRCLDMDHTDWTLLCDVGEKAAARASAAIPLVDAELAAAAKKDDPRFRIRLLGILARIEPTRGTEQLAAAIAADNDGVAAFAARILGRCGAPADRIGAVVMARLLVESRSNVASALALAACEAGAIGTTRPLLDRLRSGSVPRGSKHWFSIALAQLADRDLQAESLGWLKPRSSLCEAAVLIARRTRDARAEVPLLELLAADVDEKLATCILQSLGACGGAATRAALRSSLAMEARTFATAGIQVASSPLDARQLALLRLGDPKQVAWARATISPRVEGADAKTTIDVMTSSKARVPELLGKWNVTGAADALVACLANKDVATWVRAYAARGLCWLHDGRGLAGAAELLAGETTREFGGDRGLMVAQQTLHEFVANADRPDYVPIDAASKVSGVGKAWLGWLGKHQVTWRDPRQDTDEPLLFY